MKQRRAISVKILLWLVMGALLLAHNASAHRVNVFAWVEGDTVFVESKFAGGRKVSGGKIIVTDSTGVELLAGETNSQGEFSFKIPQKTDLKIILEAGMGHRAEWTVPVSDMESVSLAGDMQPAETSTDRVSATPTDKRSGEQSTANAPAYSNGPDLAEIETAVEKVLDQKLKPLVKMMADSTQKGPTIGDIFGGIGYIIGLVGVAAYFRYRKNNDRDQ
jgi:nickel transport protein